MAQGFLYLILISLRSVASYPLKSHPLLLRMSVFSFKTKSSLGGYWVRYVFKSPITLPYDFTFQRAIFTKNLPISGNLIIKSPMFCKDQTYLNSVALLANAVLPENVLPEQHFISIDENISVFFWCIWRHLWEKKV